MHPSAMSNGKLFFDTYVARLGEVTVVDIGAQNINGSLKEVIPANAHYTGVDFVAGKGVDVVLTDPYSLPFEGDSLDVAVSSSCFEHSEMFWLQFVEVLRVLKPGGLFFLNVPSNGVFHRHPVDCWRFYPDSGGALVSWARHCGLDPALLESYVSYQDQHCWNDFVAVFVKDAGQIDRHPHRILDVHKQFYNGRIHGKKDFINFKASPEDLVKLGAIVGIVKGDIPVR
jgi:SAM-dependent methyltransferase